MGRSFVRAGAFLVVAVVLATVALRRPSARAAVAPSPSTDLRVATVGATQTAVFAGGCFWGIEAVFEHMKGVIDVVSGYAGGARDSADYETVSSGRTGHAESVRVTFDPAQVSYGTLLQVFFSVAHDPTQLNRQGPDVGPQYRSAIFFADDDQARVARAYVEQLTRDKVYPRPIVTQVTKLAEFFQAEAYHQDYMLHHPNEPYIVYNDRPKVVHLKTQFPQLYREVRGEP